MRPLRTRLEEARRRLGVAWYVLERDYLLSWVLAGIASVPGLQSTLAFKGGTALKKCYFGDYRFSEDLDFSALEGAPTGDELLSLVGEACEAGERLLDEYAPIRLTYERYVEGEPHPGGQESFNIRARFPWQRDPQTRVKVEVTMDEPLLWPVGERRVIHDYEEPLGAAVLAYSLEEVVAEKLRAILQQAAIRSERGWSRSRARDYYDLWRVLGSYGDRMDLANFDALLREKCAARAVSFDGHEDFLRDDALAHVESTWQQSLGPLVRGLPPFYIVIDELRARVATLLRQGSGTA
ncbi:MAG: nucleotidyl transferase AbiEii/AbiGii toxin family protein [Chloroflexi bacterium]|nr:nucleotidyl transferase AbiEii/AbiGii toxin family protein [Chloroflexota bacterium]